MRNFVKLGLVSLIALITISCTQGNFNIQIDQHFEESSAKTNGNKLIVNTGKVSRVWELTPNGLLSRNIAHEQSSFSTIKSTNQTDWNLTKILSQGAVGNLVSLSAKRANDEGFTSNHLKVTAEFEYQAQGIGLKYEIWAYPKAPGLRTQLFVKKLANYTPSTDSLSLARAEYLPLNTDGSTSNLVGYYNDTQHRNTKETEILKEEKVTGLGSHDWANIIDFQSEKGGVMLVQESHKCVNQAGVNSGAYHINNEGVSASGLGISEENLTEDYRPLWGYWMVVYQGSETEQQMALKQFDRLRYPIDSKRDIYIMANNWGSGSTGDESRKASIEANILKEIQSQKDLGIDLQQVDDGWQGAYQYKTWHYVAKTKGENGGEYDVYPEGWKNIRASAKKEDIRLGLWAASWIPAEDLLRNFKEGGFTSFKLDFANLKTYDIFHEFVDKVRHFVLQTKHKVRVNWDVTENPARIGYFFGREYGNIYLENRKPRNPINVVYHPYLVLRDAWQVSKYTNLNKFQVSIQNLDRVNKEVSDAYLHNHPYSVAIAMMGSPIFFQETHYYTQEAREQIKPVLKVYKQHRNDMYKGFVFPIGEKPNNASWSGFQNYNPETTTGHLTVFREINNQENKKTIKLQFLKNVKLKLSNLLTEDIQEIDVDENGNASFTIDQAADFRFYKYEVREY